MLFLRLYEYSEEYLTLNITTRLPTRLHGLFAACIGGGIFLGTREAVVAWRDTYFTVLDDEARQDVFIGKDQTQYVHTCTRHLELCHIIMTPWLQWKYLQVYLTGHPFVLNRAPLVPRIIPPDNIAPNLTYVL
jgi:hypothetical protein